MTESLDLSFPFSGSGQFIELERTGALQKVQPLWTRYSHLRKRLEEVKARLSSCNEPAWLLRFAKKCQQQNKNFEKELRLLLDGLEGARGSLENQCEGIYSELGKIDPSLVLAAQTLVGARLPYSFKGSSLSGGKSGFDVLKRNLVVETNPSLQSSELCMRFDFEQIPLPEPWKDVVPGLESWAAAYKNLILRKRIYKMISGTRRKLRLP
jgi:hypothetical protein